MNIAAGTHEERCYQLSELFKLVNDNDANHYIWVDVFGVVHLEVRGPNVPSDALFYCETFIAGNGYVGKEASKDLKTIENHIKHLEGWWNYCKQNRRSDPEFADYTAL